MGSPDEGFATPLLPAEGARLRPLKGGKGGRLLTIADVAEELAVSTATVYKLVARGALSCIRVLNAIRMRREDLDGFEEERPQSSLSEHLGDSAQVSTPNLL